MHRFVIVLALTLLLLTGCGPVFTVELVNGAATPTQSAEPAAQEPNKTACANSGETGVPGQCQAEYALSTIITYLTLIAELCGAVVIGAAVLRALWRFVPHLARPEAPTETYTEDIRLQLGKSLALALEFELGADILKTAVAPTLAVIAQLAAIALLRTFLNYFLERELRQAEQRRDAERIDRQAGPGSPPHAA